MKHIPLMISFSLVLSPNLYMQKQTETILMEATIIADVRVSGRQMNATTGRIAEMNETSKALTNTSLQ